MNKLKLLALLFFLMLTSCNNKLTDDELSQKYLDSFNEKNWELAIQSLDEIIERHPNDANSYFARAVAKSNLKTETDLASMLKDLDETIRLDSTNHKAIFLRFQAHMLNFNFDSSLIDIDKLISLKGEIPFLLSWKGNCAFASKKFDIAEIAYDKRLDIGGPYDDMKNNYYYRIFSKYFGGNKSGALWDCGFLPEWGFEEDTTLMRLIIQDKLKWVHYSSFSIPETTIEQLEKQFDKKQTAP